MWKTSDLWLPYALVLFVQCHHSEMWHGRKKNMSGIFLPTLIVQHSRWLITHGKHAACQPEPKPHNTALKKARNQHTETLTLKFENGNSGLAGVSDQIGHICRVDCVKAVSHWSQTRPQAQEGNEQQHICAGRWFITIVRDHVSISSNLASASVR